jgi:hypothetical protein
MKKVEVKLIQEAEYKSDFVSNILFEDEYSFCFAKMEVENTTFKFAWNSKGIHPEVKIVKGSSVLFIGVDTYIVGFDYKRSSLIFYLNTSTNFKWFDDIDNGIAIVTETEVILVNVTARCTLRNCFFFGDIIMGTQIENNKMRVSFLSNSDETIDI